MTCEASEEGETFYGSTMGRRRGLVHISCELFLACVFVSSRDAPTLAITTTDLKPSGYPSWVEILYSNYSLRAPMFVRHRYGSWGDVPKPVLTSRDTVTFTIWTLRSPFCHI